MSQARKVRDRLNATFRGVLTSQGQIRNTFEADIPHDVALDKLLAPSFWWPTNQQLRPLDRIECTWEDGSRIVMLRCMGVDQQAETVLVEVISDIEFPLPKLPPGYSLEFSSKAVGWRVVREGHNRPLRSGFPTAAAAHRWLAGDLAPEVEEDEAPERGGKADKGGKDKPGGGRSGAVGKPAEAKEAAPAAT